MEIFEKKYKHLPIYSTEEVSKRPLHTPLLLKKEQIHLIKQYIVYGFHIGTKWGKSNPIEQRIETGEHYEWCREIKRNLMAFGDFKVVVIMKGYTVLVDCHVDPELEDRIIDWDFIPSFEFDFKFE